MSAVLDPTADTLNLDAMEHARKYSESMRRLVLKQLTYRDRNEHLIDFGAGLGSYAKELSAYMRMPIKCVEPAHSVGPVDGTAIEFCSLDGLEDHKACAAYSLNVFEHIADDSAAIKALTQKIQPGGYLFVLVPAHQHLWTQMDTAVGHVRRYSPEQLRDLAINAGLRVIKTGSFDRTGYWVTRLLQLLQKLGLKKQEWNGQISAKEVTLFDKLFGMVEPFLSLFHSLPGKNVWITAQRPK